MIQIQLNRSSSAKFSRFYLFKIKIKPDYVIFLFLKSIYSILSQFFWLIFFLFFLFTWLIYFFNTINNRY